PPLRLVIVEIGDVEELARLLDEGFGDGRVGVSQGIDSNAATQIQIPLAGHIISVASGAVTQDEVKPAIAGHNILLEEGLNGSRVITNNWRRSRYNIFHWINEAVPLVRTPARPGFAKRMA